jgi:hypothetical protein
LMMYAPSHGVANLWTPSWLVFHFNTMSLTTKKRS